MIVALVYLQLMTLKNALRARFLRLRQPKYFFAALVGAAYFYFFFSQQKMLSSNPLQSTVNVSSSAVDWSGLLEPAGAFLVFVAVVLAWILPNSRAALIFTEAEIAFLFPAPVPRRTLVQFKLLKSQFGILFSSFVLIMISNRWAFLGGNLWMHAVGWWLILSIYNLHLIGASFVRTRLLDLGVDAVRRRIIAVSGLAVLGVVTWFGMRRTVPDFSIEYLSSMESLISYCEAVLATPPLAWVLMPFKLVVRPFLAGDLTSFLSTLWPVVLLLVGHYFWVIRSDVAFEEASVALSQKRAERVAAVRAGKWPSRLPVKKRREPFVLLAKGMPSVAFLWKSLIAAGPFYYPKNWLLLGLVLVSGVLWFGNQPEYSSYLVGAAIVSGTVALYGLFFGPVFMRRGIGQMLERFDLLKSYPVRGWQLVLGELLCPVTILCSFEWVFLAVLSLATGFSGTVSGVTPVVLATGAVSTAFLIVPLVGLLFALNFAGLLYFPAWFSLAPQHGAGIERFGQRLIFFAGYLVLLIVVLVPAVGLGVVPFFLVSLFSQYLALAIGLGAMTACAVLVGEFAFVVWWLGRRFERFDLSEELPR